MFMKKNRVLEIIIVILTGFISGFFGAGGGLLLVPFFVHYLKHKISKVVYFLQKEQNNHFSIFFLFVY